MTVRDFFGREDVLGEIDEHLLVQEGQDIMPELRTVAISGMGGIGLQADEFIIAAADTNRENLDRLQIRQKSTE